MKVVAEGDLKELLTTGYNRRYRQIVNNQRLIYWIKEGDSLYDSSR